MKTIQLGIIIAIFLTPATVGAKGWPFMASPAEPAGSLWVQVEQPTAKGCKIEDATGTSGTQVDMSISLLPGSLRDSGTVFLTNLPDQVALTVGTKINTVWAVPVRDLSRVALLVPTGLSGHFTVRLRCMLSGQQFESAAQLAIDAAPVRQTVGVIALPPTMPRIVNQADILNADPLMTQAETLLRSGDIARARLYLEILATRGSPRAAYTLGLTYDPSYLSTKVVHGVAADPELAARWYRLAGDLGEEEANTKLSELSSK